MKKLSFLLALLFLACITYAQPDATVKTNAISKPVTIDKTKETDSIVRNINKVYSPEVLKSTVLTLDTIQKAQDVVIKEMGDSLKTATDSLAEKEKALKKEAEKKLFFGNVEPYVYKIGFVFAFIGMFIRWYYVTRKSLKKQNADKNKEKVKFNFLYWLQNNLMNKIFSAIATTLVLFVTMRFIHELFNVDVITMFYCFIIGLFFDYFLDYLLKIKVEKVLQKALPTNSTDTPSTDTPPTQ